MTGGFLSVTIVGGRSFPDFDPKDLKKKETGAAAADCRTYCTVKLGGQSYRTSESEGISTDPVWRETFIFKSEGYEGHDVVISAYQVRDKLSDIAHGDRHLGDVRLELRHYKDIPIDLAMDHWFPFGMGGGTKKNLKKDPSLKRGMKRTEVVTQGEIGVICGMDPDAQAPGNAADSERNELLGDAASGGAAVRQPRMKDISGANDDALQEMDADEVWDAALDQAKQNEDLVDSMRQTAAITREVGTEAMGQLNDQGEQMNRVENDVTLVDAQVSQAHRKMRVVDCCCCCFFTWCTRGRNRKKKRAMKEAQSDRKYDAKERERERKVLGHNRKPREDLSRAGDEDYEGMDKDAEFEARKKNIDSGLEEVGDIVSDLKDMAGEILDEVARQNEELERINPEVEHQVDRVQQATRRVAKKK
eukprot:TRINITY_DN4414_c0_g1_i1.p1 TRINITY_DN4414_c0_g1~~TRINITY_DN4414_c0_g1_i1.p1  ORF type:complete len:418 (+),score=119.83 TRINITY_DN4414_c0_g1_i1:274-1527(+)